MKKVIAIGLGPNIQKDDAVSALRLLLAPWKYTAGKSMNNLELWFETYFQTRHAITFINARSALYAILKNLAIGKDDEVIIQAFTCVVVPDPILALGAKPIYVDIDNSLNVDSDDLEKKITKKTKAIIVQHTFGISANMDAIMKIASAHKIYVIEDVAHSIGGMYKQKKLGTLGIASIFSFGRDKAFSSVFGGIAMTNDKQLGERLEHYQKHRELPAGGWVLLQLCYPIISFIILRTYYLFSVGKILHFLLRRIHFFSLPVSEDEKKGKFTIMQVKKMPNALAGLALKQLTKLEQYNTRRKNIAAFYIKHLETLQIELCTLDTNPLLRFPLLAGDKKDMKLFFAKQGMYIGDWYTQVVDPYDVDLRKVGYQKGSCPKAEEIAEHIVNLPTYPTMDEGDAERVVEVLKKYIQ